MTLNVHHHRRHHRRHHQYCINYVPSKAWRRFRFYQNSVRCTSIDSRTWRHWLSVGSNYSADLWNHCPRYHRSSHTTPAARTTLCLENNIVHVNCKWTPWLQAHIISNKPPYHRSIISNKPPYHRHIISNKPPYRQHNFQQTSVSSTHNFQHTSASSTT